MVLPAPSQLGFKEDEVFKPRKRVAALAAATVLASGLTALAATPVSASVEAAGWPVTDTDQSRHDNLLTGPDDSLTDPGCGAGTEGFSTWNEAGVKTNGTPADTLDSVCPNLSDVSATGIDGTFYTMLTDHTNSKIQKVAAFKNDQLLWSTELPITCGTNGNFLYSLTLGANGAVYAVNGNPSGYGCQYEGRLVRIDPSDGVVQWSEVIGLSSELGFGPAPMLVPYQTGLVLQPLYTPKLMYFDFDGNLTNPVLNGVGTRVDTFYGFGATQSGRVFVPIYASTYDNSCNGGTDQDEIDSYQPTGKVWGYALPACSSVWDLHPMPSGGFAALYSVKYSDRHLLVVDADGDRVIDTTPAYLYSSYEPTAQSRIMVDLAGHILFSQAFQRDNGLRGREFDLYASDGQTLLSSFSTDELGSDQNYNTSSTGIAIGQQRLYFSTGNTLHAIEFADLSMDYPRDAMLGVGPISPNDFRYVALGDSFSSGEGVEPFLTGTNIGANQDGFNKCHRSQYAYPMLLNSWRAKSISLDPLGFRACSGATTANIVEGGSHQYNEPVQDVALTMANPDVVTISIGGNNVHFSDVANACVTQGEEACTTERNNMRAAIENDLAPALRNAYGDIASKIGGNTHVFVVLYPHIFPQSRPTDRSCKWVRPFGTDRDITDTELPDLYDLTNELNQTISQVAGEYQNFVTVDPSAEFDSHDLCSASPYFNQVTIVNIFTGDTSYSYHPNQQGQSALATAVEAKMLAVLP